MGKKIMLLALVAVLALPATASALEPLHLNPTPVGTQTIHGSTTVLSLANGDTYECDGVSGSAVFEPGATSGTMLLTYSSCTLFGSKCNVTTTSLPFHLVKLPNNNSGVLVTTNSEHYAKFPCLFFFPEVKGTGIIGTIESPQCGEVSTELTIDFNAVAHGVQEHTTVAGTEAVYTLQNNSMTLALDMTLVLTLSEHTELECTWPRIHFGT